MTEWIIGAYFTIFLRFKEIVIIDKLFTCIIWRVYVYYVDFTGMGICEGG